MKPHYLLQELKDLLQSPDELIWFFDSGFADGIWYWDLENPEHEWFSDRFWEALGYKSADRERRPSAWMRLADPEDLDRASRYLTEHLGDSDFRFNEVIRFTHKSGRSVWMRCVGRAIYDANGKAIRVLGLHHDVTNDVLIEKTKRLENELVQNGFKSPEAGYWELLVSDGSVFWSSQMYLIHGVGYDFDVNLEHGLDFYSPADQVKISAAIQHAIETPGLAISKEVTLHAKNGEKVPALITFKGIPSPANGEGSQRVIGTFEAFRDDKQEKLKLERKLTDINKQLFLSSQTMNMGFLEFSKDLSEIQSCGFLPVMLDIPAAQNTAVHIKRKLKVIQEGRQVLFLPRVVQLCEDLQLSMGQRVWLGDFLLQFANKGKRNWFKAYISVRQNPNGEMVYNLLLHNFDEEKRRELERAEQQYFLKRSQQVSGVGHYVIYLEQGRWEGSAVMLDILGIDHTFEKTVDNWVSLLTEPFRESVPQQFYESVMAQSSFQMTYQIRRKSDRQIRWVEVKADFSRREDIYKTGFEPTLVGTIRDVTEGVEYTRKIEAQNAFLRKLAWSQSHEVRAPLARLMGVAEALQSMDPADPDARMFFESIMPTAIELDRVITEMNRRINAFEDTFGNPLQDQDSEAVCPPAS